MTQISMNAAQTMEAALKYAPTHRGHSGAPVDQVSRWLLMENIAEVTYFS